MKWEKVKLTDVLWFQEGPGVRNTQFREKGIKLLNVGNINDNILTLNTTKIYLSEGEALTKYSHFLVDEGDLLVASSGVTLETFHKKIAWAKKENLPLCMNTSTIRFKSLDAKKLSIRYFSFFLRTNVFNNQLRKLITGSAQLNFGPLHLKQMWLPLPPLHIQEQIADTLDKADALRRKHQELLQKYDELAQAIFYDIFGDLESAPEKLKKPLSDLLSIPSSLVDPKKKEYSDLLHVGGDNIESNTGRIFGCKKVIELGLKSGKFLFNDSMILYNKIRPYLNKVAIPDFSGVCSADMYPIIPNQGVSKEFLYYVLTSKSFLMYVSSQSRRANIPKINREELFGYKCVLPDSNIQLRFSASIKKIELIKNTLDKQKNQANNLYNKLELQYFS